VYSEDEKKQESFVEISKKKVKFQKKLEEFLENMPMRWILRRRKI